MAAAPMQDPGTAMMPPIDLTGGKSPASSQPDATASNPDTNNEDQALEAAGLDKDLEDALMEVRRIFLEAYAPKYQPFVRRANRAFEVFKNNPYILYNQGSDGYDTLDTILQGIDFGANDTPLYQYNDNFYQMLGLSFIAALSPDVPKTRYAPVDAEDEEDVLIAQKASKIRANNERKNGIAALQKLELLYLWLAGGYWSYVREIVDENRAGVSYEPILKTIDVQVAPNRYVCSNCGTETAESDIKTTNPNPPCPQCKAPLTASDWYPAESMKLPVQVGEKEVPNSMTAEDVLCGLNVIVNPSMNNLYETELLDYRGEVSVSTIRAAYPTRYSDIKTSTVGDTSSVDDLAKSARQRVTSPGAMGNPASGEYQGTYSRCWITAEAFNVLESEDLAKRLHAKFPKGCKLVTFSNNVFLQAVPERLTDHWTWCPTVKGLGAYPFGVGDAALDIQRRINDAANTIHAYMDHLAFGTIIADEDYIDVDAFTQKKLAPGNITGVSRTDDDGAGKSLEDLLFQPQFHIDTGIFSYEAQLVQKIQLIAGVQPQVFGGSDKNVQTAEGQAQQLRTAMGRMMHYIDMIHEERAARAKISVKCTVDNMDDDLKMVIEGDIEGNYQSERLLASELTGDFMTYPETDQGFPATYAEIQARLIDLLGQAKENPFIQQILSDPDTQKVVARYILPDEIKLATDAEITRLKIIMQRLSKDRPTTAIIPSPNGPQQVPMPSILPNRDYDVMGIAVTVSMNWLQTNWQTEKTNPGGFANVLAFLKIAKQYATEEQVQQQLQMAAEAGKPGAPQPQAA